MKTKTSELIGTALDWVVAKCEGVTQHDMGHWKLPILEACTAHQYTPSTDWSQGGPISERARICSRTIAQDGMYWSAYINPGGSTRASLGEPSYGPTELIAKMRCYVASKLGDEVEIPEELT